MNPLKRILKGNFTRHFLTLSSGTIVAQILPVAASPFLTRLYTPHEIGVYLSLLAIAAIMSTFAALRYDAALAQAKYRKQARALVLVGSLSCIIITLISVIFGLLLMRTGALPDQFAELGYWLLAIPALTIGNCLQAMLVNINIRHKAFRDISIATVQKAVVLVLVQVLMGLAGFGLAGLVAGSLAATIASNGRLLKNHKSSFGLQGLNRRIVKASAARYVDFPIYTMPATIVNSISLNSVILLLGLRFSGAEIGHYGLAQRSLAAPAKVIADAFGQVFLQRLTAFSRNEVGSTRLLYRKAALALMGVSTLIFVPAYLLAVPVFTLVFGTEWMLAGEAAKALIPLVAVRFVVSPLSVATQFHGMNSLGLTLQLAILAGTFGTLFYAASLDLDLLPTLRLFANVNLVVYAAFGILTYLRLGKLRA